MRLNEVNYGAGMPIDGYGPQGFRIGGTLYPGPVLLRPGGPADWKGLADSAMLVAAGDLIDVLLLGTGREIAPIPEALRAAVERAGIGLEVMGSGPACRTYNVLLGEGRRIGAALIPV
ncbi:MAG: Mth938-like domain-containing protein [Pseudomonadota bacterium]